MANIVTRILSGIEELWKKEEPIIEAAVLTAVKDVEPIWKTALGQIVLSTVTNLQGVAASSGGATAAAMAGTQIAIAAKAAGVTAAKSTVNTLIELAVQKLAGEATKLGAVATTATAATS